MALDLTVTDLAGNPVTGAAAVVAASGPGALALAYRPAAGGDWVAVAGPIVSGVAVTVPLAVGAWEFQAARDQTPAEAEMSAVVGVAVTPRPPARIDAVCDAVVARLQALNPGLSVVLCDEDDIADLPRGGPAVRTVLVLPAGYGQVESTTRGVIANDYRVAVIVYDRTDPAPDLTAWRRELAAFVEQQVYAPLHDARQADAYLLGGAVQPHAAEVAEVYDPVQLRKGRFFSELQFTYREYTAA